MLPWMELGDVALQVQRQSFRSNNPHSNIYLNMNILFEPSAVKITGLGETGQRSDQQ